MNSKIWLSSPHMGGQELKYIQEAFDTNWVAPLGPNVEGLEQDISTYFGQSSHVAALASGTSALHIALILSGVVAGDEVICQSMTFSASANPIVYCGATPVFVDSEASTWNICPQALEEAIKNRIAHGKKPKAIIAVHLYGMPCQIDTIKSIADQYEITLIEDAAESLGSHYKNKMTGTFGQFGILSFNGNKIITTSGGGALVSQNSEDKARAIFLSTQARDNAPHYQHSHIGYNYRMSNIVAGIGRGQMEVLNDRIAARRAMNAFYQDIFRDIDGVTVLTEPTDDYYSNHWLTAITIDPTIAGVDRETLRLAFLEDNIESRPLWKPMHLQPIFEECLYFGQNVSQKLFENGLCLPSGSNLTSDDQVRIKAIIDKVFNR